MSNWYRDWINNNFYEIVKGGVPLSVILPEERYIVNFPFYRHVDFVNLDQWDPLKEIVVGCRNDGVIQLRMESSPIHHDKLRSLFNLWLYSLPLDDRLLISFRLGE